MTDREQSAAFEHIVSTNLARAIEWVKYGDAKNAALLAFTSAWVAGVGSVLIDADQRHLASPVVVLLLIIEILLLAAAACAIVALLPETEPTDFLQHPKRTLRQLLSGTNQAPSNRNLLYYGYISTLEPGDYKKQIRERYRVPRSGDSYLADACEQTVINSRIAQRKFNWFTRGVLIVFAALVLLLIPYTIGMLRAII